MFEDENAQWGLVHALVLDGEGGARTIARTELNDLQLQAHESIWLHWDRSHPLKSVRRGVGDVNVPVTFAGVTFRPGEFIYADNNGVIISPTALKMPG